jgi:hypothetical protein
MTTLIGSRRLFQNSPINASVHKQGLGFGDRSTPGLHKSLDHLPKIVESTIVTFADYNRCLKLVKLQPLGSLVFSRTPKDMKTRAINPRLMQ